MPGDIDYASLLARLTSAAFAKLRDAQELALALYGSDHTATADLAIELPTGAGRSLIALLM